MNKWIYQTKAHEKTLAPVWCEEFETTVTCPAEIVVELWDKDTLKDDYIGQATVTLTGSTLWAHTLVMTDKKGQRSGEVKLTFQEGSSRGYMTSF
ncbi:hypothetical protein CYY_004111 [Polysphondylium violaceum]|uniref:C2 domain-containing protein n=1 Tax=Polysphondylium violaceum TaxID=133409 RepID=A0A8J4PYS5_9MYCE|nr:hypothetical protein CYY_004111 [Polysphondylium violaceum]